MRYTYNIKIETKENNEIEYDIEVKDQDYSLGLRLVPDEIHTLSFFLSSMVNTIVMLEKIGVEKYRKISSGEIPGGFIPENVQ